MSSCMPGTRITNKDRILLVIEFEAVKQVSAKSSQFLSHEGFHPAGHLSIAASGRLRDTVDIENEQAMKINSQSNH